MAVCPDIVFSLTNQLLTAFDGTVFVFDQLAQTLETYTNDPNKIGVYPLRLAAQYDGAAYSEAGFLDFQIEVIDPCLNDAVLTPAI